MKEDKKERNMLLFPHPFLVIISNWVSWKCLIIEEMKNLTHLFMNFQNSRMEEKKKSKHS